MHGYGPDTDFHRRLKIVADSPAAGVWINRYGYLSDSKLASVGQLFAKGGRGARIMNPQQVRTMLKQTIEIVG
ncbi:MAG: hypothetical protein Ct9H300mP1_26440 [Planctomycetaceae bacterium]|nr:MAG: hypothetical protein Ct9H300mP1_26440 [Planctomycetaceae bacterium]